MKISAHVFCVAVLQVIREIKEIVMRNLHDGFPNKIGQFVSVLDWSGKTQRALKKVINWNFEIWNIFKNRSYWPIVVHVRQCVSKTLVDIRREVARILDNVVSSWWYSSLSDFLGNQGKVEALVESHNRVHRGTARRISWSSLHGEEASVDSLTDNDKGDARPVGRACFGLPFQDIAYLVAGILQMNWHNQWQIMWKYEDDSYFESDNLRLLQTDDIGSSHTVAIDNDLRWQFFLIIFIVRPINNII